MHEWWSEIPNFQKVFWYIAFPSTAIFIIQNILSILGVISFSDDIDFFNDGVSHDINLEDISNEPHESMDYADYGNNEKRSFRLFTMRNCIIFLTVFSWTGITASSSGLNKMLTIILSFLLGLFIMIIVSSIFYFIGNLSENGSMKLTNAINKVGEVYLTVPAKRQGFGKVTIIIQGAYKELDAVTDGEDIKTGEKIVVIGVVQNQQLLVEKYN